MENYQAAEQWKDFFFISEIDGIVIVPADVNGDETVNAADIVEVVNYIMGNASEKFNEEGADANGDGVVNAADIVTIVNIIMGQ